MTELLRERRGTTERWTMSNPSNRNALDDAVVDALLRACAEGASDPSLRFIVLTGEGRAFCAGGNLGGMASSIGKPWPASEPDPLIAMNQRFGDLLHALAALPQLLVAAVDGPAFAGGLGLVCCADFVLASPAASFAAPEVTLGIAPAQIAPFVWKRLGHRGARQVLLQARRFDALQAQALGLVDEVADDLAAATERFIQSLSVCAPQAVASTKRLLHELESHAMRDLRPQAALAFATSLRGTEAPEGIAAFAQKRAASWAQ
jgi:isohexenylglutaconyl-CoA hydratase